MNQIPPINPLIVWWATSEPAPNAMPVTKVPAIPDKSPPLCGWAWTGGWGWTCGTGAGCLVGACAVWVDLVGVELLLDDPL